jgi:hypothetical protein
MNFKAFIDFGNHHEDTEQFTPKHSTVPSLYNYILPSQLFVNTYTMCVTIALSFGMSQTAGGVAQW